MTYKITDHTADFGMHVFGSDLQDLFTNAGHALYDVITDVERLKGIDMYEIHVTGDDWPDLMVNWLREMLFFWTGKELLVKKVTVLSISEYELTASVSADPYNPDHHIIKDEIKAVTYHQIQVNRGEAGWDSKIIFDV